MRLRMLPLLIVPAVVIASSCGYHLVGHGGQFPAGVDRVTVPIFENATKDKVIARRLTNHFIRELMATGGEGGLLRRGAGRGPGEGDAL